MRRLKRDTRGAVTIIVSIMLIPAILLSGTAVDLARIHTAKSMAQNANQLAGNTVLTQYNALLKDLYGLFGVAEYDPVLAGMVNDYIQVSIFGEKKDDTWIDTGLGTFQIFHGSEASAEVTAANTYNLGNVDVLRRQIEEYMKFRGPVILVVELLEALSIQGSSIKASSEAIEQQKKVDEGMGELFKLYGELYAAIQRADLCPQPGGNPNVAGAVGNVGNSLTSIKNAFADLQRRYKEWEDICKEIKDLEDRIAATSDDLQRAKLNNQLELLQGEKSDLEKRYVAKFKHIEALTNGNNATWQDWRSGDPIVKKDPDGNTEIFEDGATVYEWKGGQNIAGGTVAGGLINNIDNAKNTAERFKANFTAVVTKAGEIDSKREQIRAEIARLQGIIDNPDCDATLREELRTQIVEINALLNEFPNLANIARPYQEEGNAFIERVKTMLDGVEYRDRNNTASGSLSISDLRTISSNSAFALNENVASTQSAAAKYAGFELVTYQLRDLGFINFRGIDGNATYTSRRNLYDKLQGMATTKDVETISIADGLTDDSGSDDPETKQRNIIQQLVKLAEDARDGLINNPQGARRIVDSTVMGTGSIDTIDASKVIDLISDPGNGIQELADWALVMTYCTSMFSSYTTGKPSEFSGGVKPESPTSITSTPMNPKVNYFYQSEWEYLLVGNQDANANLNAVKNLIYTIRLICNTISAFKQDDIKAVANLVKAAVSAIPFVGPALGVVLYFATFAAFAAAESAVDLIDLRNGCKVVLIKGANDEKFKCKPSGVVALLKELGDGDISLHSVDTHKNEPGISYEQYMLIFFLVTSRTNTLVTRTGNLIQWNVVNYQKKANANNLDDKGFVKTDDAVNAMSAAFEEPDCFRLSKMHTDFDVTTTIDLRLLFLTLPIFQREGSPFSDRFQISATHYRGY